MRRSIYRVIIASAGLLLTACDSPKPRTASQSAESATQQSVAQGKLPAKIQNASMLLASAIHSALSSTKQLHSSVQFLLESPTAEALHRAQQQWRTTATHIEALALLRALSEESSYAHTEALTFAQQLNTIQAWPIQAGYLDATEQSGKVGLIYDIDTPLTESALRDQHQLAYKHNATLGIYALGVMLFGPSDNRLNTDFKSTNALSPKQLNQGYTNVNELPRNRRRTLLNMQVALLEKDLTYLQATWRNSNNPILEAFSLQAPPKQLASLKAAYLRLASTQLLSLQESCHTGVAHWLTTTHARQSQSAYRKALQHLPTIPTQPLLDTLTVGEPVSTAEPQDCDTLKHAFSLHMAALAEGISAPQSTE